MNVVIDHVVSRKDPRRLPRKKAAGRKSRPSPGPFSGKKATCTYCTYTTVIHTGALGKPHRRCKGNRSKWVTAN